MPDSLIDSIKALTTLPEGVGADISLDKTLAILRQHMGDAAIREDAGRTADDVTPSPVRRETSPTTTPLLPCPFCGNAAEITFWDNDEGTNGYYPNCSYCTCEIEGLYTKEESINVWNKRAVVRCEISDNDGKAMIEKQNSYLEQYKSRGWKIAPLVRGNAMYIPTPDCIIRLQGHGACFYGR